MSPKFWEVVSIIFFGLSVFFITLAIQLYFLC